LFLFRFTCIWCTWTTKNALPLTTTLWVFTKPAISILELVKNWGAGLLSTISSIHSMFFMVCLPFSQNLSNKGKRKHSEKEPPEKKKKQRNEQPWTLAYTLVLQKLSSHLTLAFSPDQLVCPPQWCHSTKSQFDCGPEPSFKGLGTNVKLLTNTNAWYHWTLLLGTLSKVALSTSRGPIKKPEQMTT